MTSNTVLFKADLVKSLPKMTDRALLGAEIAIYTRMGNLQKFSPWPALEASLAQDLESVWREQKLRKLNKEKRNDNLLCA